MNKERRVGRRSVVQNLVKLTPEYDNGKYFNIILSNSYSQSTLYYIHNILLFELKSPSYFCKIGFISLSK